MLTENYACAVGVVVSLPDIVAFRQDRFMSLTSSLLGYTGQYRDPITGGYPLGNGYRTYLPGLMRFNSRDSFSPFGSAGVNPYAYCMDDPINRVDPSGHVGEFVEFGQLLEDLVESTKVHTNESIAVQRAMKKPRSVKFGQSARLHTYDPDEAITDAVAVKRKARVQADDGESAKMLSRRGHSAGKVKKPLVVENTQERLVEATTQIIKAKSNLAVYTDENGYARLNKLTNRLTTQGNTIKSNFEGASENFDFIRRTLTEGEASLASNPLFNKLQSETNALGSQFRSTIQPAMLPTPTFDSTLAFESLIPDMDSDSDLDFS